MNIKLHTPKSLKMGSGMASMKQLMLSIIATTISIALTFGTAAFLDKKKKENEKREIVMMVMYDMYNSLQSIGKADSTIQQAMARSPTRCSCSAAGGGTGSRACTGRATASFSCTSGWNAASTNGPETNGRRKKSRRSSTAGLWRA